MFAHESYYYYFVKKDCPHHTRMDGLERILLDNITSFVEVFVESIASVFSQEDRVLLGSSLASCFYSPCK